MYRQKVAPLGEALEKPQERDAAASAIRGLNERIVLVPGTEGGDLQVTLQGDFGAILRMDGKRGQNRIDRHSPRHTPAGAGAGPVGRNLGAISDRVNVAGLACHPRQRPVSGRILSLGAVPGSRMSVSVVAGEGLEPPARGL